jgi:GNAT superfamily N-acetyltransferase
MAVTLRPCRLPEEYETLAAIQNAGSGQPTTAGELAGRDGWMPETSLLRRVVAEDESGAVVGFAEAYRYPNTPEGKFYIHVAVLPVAQHRGVGTALLEHVEQFAREHGGNRFTGEVADRDATALAYLQKRGYEIERHGYDSRLTLSEFDAAAFHGVIEAVEAKGVRFFTLADAPGDEIKRALYDLYSRTMVDIPGYEAKSFMAYETWHKFVLEGEGCRPDWVFIAAEGERLVGVTTMVVSGDHVYTNHTLVDRAYRGRGIALALKVLAVQAAVRFGAPYMRTGNDSQNGPMLAVNRRLGYQPLAGYYTVVKRFS